MISNRLREIPPFIVMDVLARAQELERQGKPVVHLEVGQPDFPVPQKIQQAAVEAIQRGETRYTPSLGIPALREALAAHYHARYSVQITPDQIVITSGTSPGLLLALSALVNPGDEVILANPGYACYPNHVRFLDGVPVHVRVHPENGFVLDPSDVRKAITSRTRAILINSPANPTGAVLPADVLTELASLGPPLISDEIYHGLVYGVEDHSALEFTDRAFVLNGFSKLYAMTGYRLGYLIAPPEYVRPIEKAQQNLFICASSIAQWAGVAAVTQEHPEIPQMVRTYDERRRFIVRRLRELGFGVQAEPRGAFYVLADARRFDTDSYRLAQRLLEDVYVAVTPGIDFGSGAEGFLRFSYAASLDSIKEAMERLGTYLGRDTR
ncbi:MAG TPA: pyridoxal phosphate-dependent aminotransferase [Bacteroidetes bacterium]|nr:pyridoxal phosphate-dependent aminotransferase [Bacteroidota bacterium]